MKRVSAVDVQTKIYKWLIAGVIAVFVTALITTSTPAHPNCEEILHEVAP